MNVIALSSNLRIVLEEHYIPYLSHFIVILSVGAFYIWAFILNVTWAIGQQLDNFSGMHGYGIRCMYVCMYIYKCVCVCVQIHDNLCVYI